MGGCKSKLSCFSLNNRGLKMSISQLVWVWTLPLVTSWMPRVSTNFTLHLMGHNLQLQWERINFWIFNFFHSNRVEIWLNYSLPKSILCPLELNIILSKKQLNLNSKKRLTGCRAKVAGTIKWEERHRSITCELKSDKWIRSCQNKTIQGQRQGQTGQQRRKTIHSSCWSSF